MAGTTLKRQLKNTGAAGVRFEVASQPDDASIRHLLHVTPLAGRVAISLEREPSYFADAELAGETKQTIVAYDNGNLVCAGSCVIRERFVNGQERRVGYLGGLRLKSQVAAGRFDIVRRGYEFFRELQAEAPADFYFTSIAADNDRARRFLERGVARMPIYEFVGDFTTFLISTNRARVRGTSLSGCKIEVPATVSDQLVDFLGKFNQRLQFQPCWSTEELRSLERLELRASDFHVVRKGGEMIACGALWDQRSYKQTVIREYAPWLRMARPIVNCFSHVIDIPRLPKVGEILPSAFASHFASSTGRIAELLEMTTILAREARERGIEFLVMGFASSDSCVAIMRRIFSCREYQSRLYTVRWPGIGGSAAELDNRSVAPEVALL